MAVHVSHAALPYPIKGARFSVLVPLLDADGDPTAQTTPDTELSKDNAAPADAAEEVSATSGMDGMGLITFSGAETDCSSLAANFKAASGPKATLGTFYPRVLATVGSGTLSAGSAGGGTLGTLLAYDVTGCFIKTTGGTGGGGTGGANNQARKIVTYNTSTGAFTVTPDWETTPSTDTTYDILLPEGVTLGMLRTLNPTTAGRTLDVSSGGEAGVDWANVGSPTTTLNLSGTTVKTATDVEAIVGSGTHGNAALKTLIDAVDNFVDTEVAAIISTLGTPSNLGGGATIAANLSDIEAQTDDIGTAGAGLTAVPWNAAWDAEVQSEVQDAIEANNLDHLVKIAVDTNFATTVHLDSVIGHLADAGGTATFDRTTDALEALQAEHDATQTAINTVDDFLDTEVAAILSAVDTEITAIIAAIGTPANLGGGGGATLAGNLSDIEAQTDDLGSAGAGLSAIPWNAAWDAEVQSEVDDALKATLTEGYRSTGAVGSVRDLLYELIAHMGECSISSTTKTLKKLDGSTTAKTYTLNSATTPTSITETT